MAAPKPKRQLTDKQRAALRPPWKPGENPGTRVSNSVYRAIAMARRACPNAIAYAERVIADEREPTALRLKAVDLVLTHGMPKGDTSKYLSETSVGQITLNLVMPEASRPLPLPPVVEGVAAMITEDTPTQGSGD